jgi:undecaprenyl-diphosphatase
MALISYPGSTPLLPALIVLAAVICWVLGLRLEAVVVVGLSTVSAILNVLIKLLVARPRPAAGLVEMLQRAMGSSFPSGHVMAYFAFWGLLFSLGVILFTIWRWWRILLLVVSACFVVLVGPSRIYLGDHWASDVLGSYLIGGVLLGLTLGIYLRLKREGALQTERARKITQRSRLLRSFPWK